MTTRQETAALAAMLARRAPADYSPGCIAADAMKLCRIATAAVTSATNLCNIPNYQEKHDRKKASLRRTVAPIAERYGLRAEIGGDPRGGCLHLFALPGTAELRGNGWGGDEGGYCV